jgi:hypothetical protein
LPAQGPGPGFLEFFTVIIRNPNTRAAHGQYDRRNDDVSVGEVERIGI